MKTLFYTITLFLIIGCSENQPIIIQPKYPLIETPREVQPISGTFLRNGCLWIVDHNSNLCGNDYILISSVIKNLRINDSTMRKSIKSYNDFTSSKKQSK